MWVGHVRPCQAKTSMQSLHATPCTQRCPRYPLHPPCFSPPPLSLPLSHPAGPKGGASGGSESLLSATYSPLSTAPGLRVRAPMCACSESPWPEPKLQHQTTHCACPACLKPCSPLSAPLSLLVTPRRSQGRCLRRHREPAECHVPHSACMCMPPCVPVVNHLVPDAVC
jgi:hypothetical protein